MDLLLDTKANGSKDLVFENGKCPVVQERASVVAQRLLIRLRTFYQEWFMNVDYGVPYLERILGKKVKQSTVDAIIQEHIYKERGVTEIISFTSTMSGRNYSCRFQVKADDGSITEEITI